MDALTRRTTFEDRFDRNWRCNPSRFVPKMKRGNRKALRRKLKQEDAKRMEPIVEKSAQSL